MTGTVLAISIAETDGAPQQPLPEAELVAGAGVAGDRYSKRANPKPDKEVTLIESELVERFNADTGLNIDATETRRNIVTLGVSLNELVGVEFTVGEVRLRGERHCTPCKYLADLLVASTGTTLTAAEITAALHERGGLRCGVLTSGNVRVGDAITVPVTA